MNGTAKPYFEKVVKCNKVFFIIIMRWHDDHTNLEKHNLYKLFGKLMENEFVYGVQVLVQSKSRVRKVQDTTA